MTITQQSLSAVNRLMRLSKKYPVLLPTIARALKNKSMPEFTSWRWKQMKIGDHPYVVEFYT